MGLCVSVISHGHGPEVLHLLNRLADLPGQHGQPGHGAPARVIVTLNVPEPALAQALAQRRWPFDLRTCANPAPLGFGANHNRAFALDGQLGASAGFAVLNPDVDWPAGQNPLLALHRALAAAGPQAGLAYPVQVDAQGRLQDHERLLPTPARLLRRYLPWGRRHEVAAGQGEAAWVNAAFLLLPRPAYAAVGGFDEGYHMYCEDVDLCLRLRLAGWRMVRAQDALVTHRARRASHRHLRHLLWHVQSLLRLWRSAAWQHTRARERASP